MSELPWLSDEELRTLTGKVRPSAQRRVLAEMGIDYRPATGPLVRVFRSSFDVAQEEHGKKQYQPDMSAV